MGDRGSSIKDDFRVDTLVINRNSLCYARVV